MNIYIVTRGSYSDYSILGAYSTRENAEAALKVWNDEWDKPEIEEWPIDAHLSRGDQLPWMVWMRHDGAEAEASKTDPPEADDSTWWSNNTFHRDLRFRWMGWADDEQHAIKIANERRLIDIAEGRNKP